MPIPIFGRKPKSNPEAFLDSTYPDSPPDVKLHALLCCVAKSGGGLLDGDFTAVANRCKLSRDLVQQVMTGNILNGDPQWWALEALLKAFNASAEEIKVAMRLYNQLGRATGTVVERRLDREKLRDQALPLEPQSPSTSNPVPPSSPRSPDSDVRPIEEASTGFTSSPPKMDMSWDFSMPPSMDIPMSFDEWPGCAAPLPLDLPLTPSSTASEAPISEVPVVATAASTTVDEVQDQEPEDRDLATNQDDNSEADFVERLSEYRILKGEPPFRDMERALKERKDVNVEPVTYGTFSNMLRKNALPTVRSLKAFAAALGDTQEEIDEWVRQRNLIRAATIRRRTTA
ncbi:hypothetical protein [Nonomuraea sp. NPDC049158]|uniref:hypothetical protein n=1 Tax=Nonomuraea sp. NPDC049158 TaxID=3155649 RepID=UPI0033C2511E